ncbi:leucine-rich repeat-containing protein 34 [Denticeps clupeoides]|uniref:leucine-rich repeat-containing protein 34 n=1 Tax=Denticeps clupeoides TaxID=299321 RepID=UPI0010A59254|nr:leucine-rich repeat-containing protein 34 [Denticeps clupeoides]
MGTVGTLGDLYSQACSETRAPVNSSAWRVLRQLDASATDVRIRLAGHDRAGPAQRLSDSDTSVLLGALRHSSVAGLDLRYNNITDNGAKHLADFLQENRTIQSLDLMGNDIEGQGAELIAESLHRNTSLRTLRMTGNKIGKKGAMSLAAMMQMNTTLQELDISDCDLDTEGLVAISFALRQSKNIRSVNVTRPLLFSHQEETTVHLSQMLLVNHTLRELHLGKHGMTDSGVERLCEALRINHGLRYLDLRCNRITRDGAKCLSAVLRERCLLEILDLSFNHIEDEGAVLLGAATRLPHSRLKALSISSNNIGTRGLVSLAEAMRASCTLTHIYIWGNKLEEPVCEAFSQLIGSGRLLEPNTDVSPYAADGRVCLAETFHGLNRHYYWTPSYGHDGDPASCSAQALSTL